MKELDAAAVKSAIAHVLGARSGEDIDDDLLGSATRRAAAFVCPCPRHVLRRAVLEPLRGLGDSEALEEAVGRIVDLLVEHGDLVEASIRTEGETRRLIFAAPPAFVPFDDRVLMLGVAPDAQSPLSPEVDAAVKHDRHARWLVGTDHTSTLSELGFIHITPESWMQAPEFESAARHVARAADRLARQPRSSAIPDLTIMDPESPVRYYKGRWTNVRRETGVFVGRRPQTYGENIWCVVELEAGNPLRSLDLPLKPRHMRGCDEAWRLQAAIDAQRGSPQGLRVERDGEAAQLSVFSPIPMWLGRRWSTLGREITPRNCLRAFEFASERADDEAQFAAQALWLTRI